MLLFIVLHTAVPYIMNSHAAIRGAPRARTRTWATIRIQSVDMLYLGAFTGVGVISDGRYYGLLR